MQTATPSTARFYALRLLPQQELLTALRHFIRLNGLHAAWISGCVGSLSDVALRYAGREGTALLSGKFEVVSLIGTLEAGGEHLHMAVADENGHMTGGHVMEGCTVRTTLELVIGELNDAVFSRQPCTLSGYDELNVKPR
ncbi:MULTISPECIES: PPC domain-containing DNA-binding protein [unclassified Serratia (in: enterobacteria)]|uniref:PPC domain-containing DNA-binding protein n=1 Tax=unclassified Serratia (in: enterobacteria) TaxID=2647522 RepID=UPI003075F2F8